AATGLSFLSVWDLGRPGADPLLLLSEDRCSLLTYDPSGQRLAHTGRQLLGVGSFVHVRELDRLNVDSLELRVPEAVVVSLAFSPKGNRLISTGLDKASGRPVVRAWDLKGLVAEPHAANVLSDQVQPVALSPDGTRLAGVSTSVLAGIDKSSPVRIWDLNRPG